MKVVETNFTDAKLLEPRLFGDERGFSESYNKQVLETLGITYSFVQDNVSYSAKAGTIRGLHFQNRKHKRNSFKLCKGQFMMLSLIYEKSPTFKQWKGYILSADNHRQLLVPKGFAHGFCTLVPHTIVMYKVDEYYSAEHDSGLLWEDKDLAIPWPVTDPILSDKDQILPLLEEYEDSF